MKIIINSNKYIRLLVSIHNLFGPEDSMAKKMLNESELFGKEFHLTAQIYTDIKTNIKKSGQNKFWTLFLDKNMPKTKQKYPNLIKKLNQLIKLNNKNKTSKEISNQIIKNFKKHETKINYLLNNIFLFNLPEEVNLIVDYDITTSFTGSSLSYDPVIISVQMPEYANKIMTISLHEILHSLINKNKTIPEDKYRFEEALLDYFAPRGIIDEKLNLINNFNIKERFEQIIFNRPYVKEEAQKLLPIIKNYYKVSEKTNIWKFLKKSGYKFINL